MEKRSPVLLVEPDAATSEVVCEVLKTEGIDVIPTHSLADARDYLARTLVCGVILARSGGDNAACDLLAELTVASTPPPVVLMSGDPEDAQVAKRYGVDFERKPFDADALVAAVEKMRRS
jgi:DNA-binding response OmpR family regulator